MVRSPNALQTTRRRLLVSSLAGAASLAASSLAPFRTQAATRQTSAPNRTAVVVVGAGFAGIECRSPSGRGGGRCRGPRSP